MSGRVAGSLLAFRDPRGPLGRAGAGRAGDDEDDENDNDKAPAEPDDGDGGAPTSSRRRAAQRTLNRASWRISSIASKCSMSLHRCDANADLPGRQYLVPLLRETEFKFGGAAWQHRRKARRYSTALSAPINYGPGLKMLGWVHRHPEYPDIMVPNPAATPALDAFEAEIGDLLDHEAFSAFGSVTVTRDEARAWADAWSLDAPTEASLIATSRPRRGSRPRYTSPMPPAPMAAMISYGPRRVPAGRTMTQRA